MVSISITMLQARGMIFEPLAKKQYLIPVRYASLAVKQSKVDESDLKVQKSSSKMAAEQAEEKNNITSANDTKHPTVFTGTCTSDDCWKKICSGCKVTGVFKSGNLSHSKKGFSDSITIPLENQKTHPQEKPVSYIGYHNQKKMTPSEIDSKYLPTKN